MLDEIHQLANAVASKVVRSGGFEIRLPDRVWREVAAEIIRTHTLRPHHGDLENQDIVMMTNAGPVRITKEKPNA